MCLIWQDDDDGHLIVLGIAEELMVKAADVYLEQFARLGVFSKVEALAAAPAATLSADGESLLATGESTGDIGFNTTVMQQNKYTDS